MKKYLLISLLFLFTSCGSNEHIHHYSEWEVEINPTCLEEGKEVSKCECGDLKYRSILALGHNFSNYEVVKEPTCLEEGKEERECSRCLLKEERAISKINHQYENGECIYCHQLESNEKIINEGLVKAYPNYGCNGESDWEVNVNQGIYTSISETNALLSFNNYIFEGGIIEFDLSVGQGNYAFNSVCGIIFASNNQIIKGNNDQEDNYYCFGRAFTGEYVGYSINSGVFSWEDYSKLSSIECPQGVNNHFKLEYDNINNIIYLTYGEASTFFIPKVRLNGMYFGLYSEVKNSTFSNIVITPKTYQRKNINIGNQSVFKEENDTYIAETDVASGILKDYEFVTGTVEYDMLVPEGNYAFNTVCGLIWGAKEDLVNIYTSEFLCSGRYVDGIYVTYAKYFDGTNTSFAWENAQQIADGNLMPRNQFVHYVLKYDGNQLTLSINDISVSFILNHQSFGKYIGLYSEVKGTTFKNIKVY